MARNVTSTDAPANGSYYNLNTQSHRRIEAITPGEGWQLLHSYGDGCNGSLSSANECGRLASSNCLLEGHQGSRGGVWGNETTGWLVLPAIKTENGYIALNLEVGSRDQTRRALHEALPDSFVFEYAVEGAITTLGKAQFIEKVKRPVPGMNLLPVFDETTTEAKDLVVALRVKGCPENPECQFALTHVYWS